MRINIGLLAVIVTMITLCGTVAVQAAESKDSYSKLMTRWTRQRDDAVKRITHSWLRGATAGSLQQDLLKIISLDVRLANENVPLYVTSLRDPSDIHTSITDLVHRYLERLGVIRDSADFFRGRKFRLIREEKSINGKPDSDARLPMAFSKWNKK